MTDVNEDRDLTEYKGSGVAMLGTVDAVRVQKETEGAIVVARRFPRNSAQVYAKIMSECERPSLAKKAVYKYPRGKNPDGTKNFVSGPTIRIAEVFARNWGNLSCGTRELSRGKDSSNMESFCWDMETNVRFSRIFDVPHTRDTKNGTQKLTDGRDIYEATANNAARRLRACILEQIPVDIVEDALARCEKTLAGEIEKNIEVWRRELVAAFSKYGVTMEMMEKRLGHKIEEMSTPEAVEYRGIYMAIYDGMAKREDYFEFAAAPTTDETTEAIDKRLSTPKKELTEAEKAAILADEKKHKEHAGSTPAKA